jgi:hypothetical protein
MRYYTTFYCFIFLVFLFCGCGYKSHKKLIKNQLVPYSKMNDQVQLLVHPLNAEESKQELGRNALKKGYQPIKIVIENNADSYLILHPWYIGLPIAQPKKVAKALHRNNFFITTAAIGVGIIGLEWCSPLAVFLFGAIPLTFLIGWNNAKITDCVLQDSINRGVETIIIPPHGHIKRSIFVSEADFKSDFMLTLFDTKENKAIRFEVSLQKPKDILNLQSDPLAAPTLF